mmetsp:Transcript_6048/g.9247  ORF Transcript_6048/g.9247 Transcript_6048/m.9247 type:complete len:317 (+) Transcript_6048:125-1075(+)
MTMMLAKTMLSNITCKYFLITNLLARILKNVSSKDDIADTVGADWEKNVKDGLIWYISYGSNMSEEMFKGKRKISFEESRKCIIPGYTLSYDYDAYPFSEPCFATCVKQEDYIATHIDDPTWPQHLREEKRPDVHGVAFLITKEDFLRTLATEGGNGWNDGTCGGYRISRVDAKSYNDTSCFPAVTLTHLPTDNRRPGLWMNCPSQRYKGLVVNGAKNSGLDPAYIQWLEKQPSYDTSRNKRSKRIVDIFMIPCFWHMFVARGLFLDYFKMNRYPWFAAKCFHIYNILLHKTLFPLLSCFCGETGYCNNIDRDKLV